MVLIQGPAGRFQDFAFACIGPAFSQQALSFRPCGRYV